MCGIAGLISRKPSSTGDLMPVLRAMSEEIKHRGPDDSGFWSDAQYLGFAHTRLAVQDLSQHGHQPMVSASGRFVISFNGEIYNFVALRRELSALGHKFHGHSDTEIILASLEQWGLHKSVPRFDGMFAFAVYDRNKRSVSFARDRIGEKPLYLTYTNQYVAFSSDLRAFRRITDWQPEVDRRALASYCRFGYVPAPFSIYAQTCKLLPGHTLTFSIASPDSVTNFIQSHGKEHVSGVFLKKYWDLKQIVEQETSKMFTTPDAAVSGLQSALSEVISEQLVADVPMGALLSGGIDSSAVVATMQSLSIKPIQTFSIGFSNADYDEAKFAKQIARALGTEHAELYITAEDALNVVTSIPDIYSEPLADSSQIPAILVSQFARQKVTVCLTGDGGDELFGGYNRYTQTAKLWKSSQIIPSQLRSLFAQWIKHIPAATIDSSFRTAITQFGGSPRQHVGSKLHKIANILTAPSLSAAYLGLVSFTNDPDSVVQVGHEHPLHSSFSCTMNFDLISQFMLLDSLTYLPDDNLAKMDRASMAVALELRLPLLDRRVIECAWRTPPAFRHRDGKTKWPLRKLLYNHLPRNLVDRPKMGFSVPLSAWLRTDLREWASELLCERRLASEGFFEPQKITEIWNQHLSGKSDHANLLWSVLMFQSWLSDNSG